MRKDQLSFERLLLVAITILASPVTQALGQTTQPRSPQPVSQSAKRAGEVFALADSTDAASLEKIRRALSDPDWYVRGEAARALGLRGDNRSSSALLTLTTDENWFVRAGAIEALGALGDSSDFSVP